MRNRPSLPNHVGPYSPAELALRNMTRKGVVLPNVVRSTQPNEGYHYDLCDWREDGNLKDRNGHAMPRRM